MENSVEIGPSNHLPGWHIRMNSMEELVWHFLFVPLHSFYILPWWMAGRSSFYISLYLLIMLILKGHRHKAHHHVKNKLWTMNKYICIIECNNDSK